MEYTGFTISYLNQEVMVSEKLLTTGQAADRLGVSRVTINKWIDQGLFPHAYKLSGLKQSPYRIPETDVIDFETRRTNEQRITA